MKYYLLLFTFAFTSNIALGQLAVKGTPESFQNDFLSGYFQEISLPIPDLSNLKDIDFNDKLSMPHPFSRLISVKLNPENSGTWEWTDQGKPVWRLKVRCEGALALSLYFSDFYLPEGAELYIYNEDHKQLKGAFTSLNNPLSRLFATDLVIGDALIMELNLSGEPDELLAMEISDIGYAFRDVPNYLNSKGFGSSDFCEINVGCSPEGDNWQDERRGVVRIKVRVGGQAYWCTGSIINNTSLDLKPYVLTADHCAFKYGNYATPENLNQWIFYLNYESPTCTNPDQEPPYFSMVGATKIAYGGNQGQTGSDFYLVLLNENIPDQAGVYFNGWNAQDAPSSNGVTIHHPEGDIKKISTYTSQPQTFDFLSNGIFSHWEVFWSQTQNNWGVTEPGSSGSPLFDNQGRIIGTLSAGYAACEPSGFFGPDKPDYYGKFSYHWVSNGTDDTLQLKPWLDPNNTGMTAIGGTALGTNDKEPQGIVEVFPNPAEKNINFIINNSEPIELNLYLLDIFGRILNFQKINSGQSFNFDISDAKPGMYLLVAEWSEGRVVKRIIKK
ncbi:MAG: T9SS type A sorting domain-containing protein [Bacteroidales bacterium]|nr:T9SS type A sorting domain-containing protein [Bacteroidales bacterium]